MVRKRILIVLQESLNLVNAKEELYKVSSMHNVEIVAGGRVSLLHIRNALRFAQKWDIVWFVVDSGWNTDNDTGYMDLEGGASGEDIVSIVRASGCDLVILNSCSSIAIATQIAEQTTSDVVSTVVDVPDVQAVLFGVTMAKLISDGKTYFEAFRMARPPHNKTYVYMTSLSGVIQAGAAAVASSACDTIDTISEILSEVMKLRQEVFSWRLDIETRLTKLESYVFPNTNILTKRDISLVVMMAVLGLSFTISFLMLLRWFPFD